MANRMLAQSVNRENVGKALRQLRLECRHNQREMNAINRAALELEASAWTFDGETLVIQSAKQALPC